MPLLERNYIRINNAGNIYNPVDSTTYYIGLLDAAPTTTANIRNGSFPISGTITSATISVIVTGTLGSTEDTSFSVRINNTTDYTLSSSIKHDATSQIYNISELSIPINIDDFLEIKIVTPTFSTNPTGVIYGCTLVMETM